MCEHDNEREHDHSAKLDRRGFGRLILAGAAAGAASSILPATAEAAGDCPRVTPVPALAVMCIDYRLPTPSVDFFNRSLGLKRYDIVGLAGASLACGSEHAFPKTVDAFYEQVKAAWTLHRIQKVVFLDHMDCGAFKVEFNHACDFTPPGAEFDYHLQVKHRVMAEFPRRIHEMQLPPIDLDFWIFMNPNSPSAVPLTRKAAR